MVRSMTAFGRMKQTVNEKDIVVEIKAVNNRYLDISVKMPRAFGYLEEKVKGFIQENGVTRGKVDIYISIELPQSELCAVTLDYDAAKNYINALNNLKNEFSLVDDISVMKVAQNRDIFKAQKSEEDADGEWRDLRTVLDGALSRFKEAREAEGQRLANDIIQKKEKISGIVCEIEAESACACTEYEKRLRAKLKATLDEFNFAVDESRIITECAVFADRIAIDEETVRLKSHFTAFDEILSSEEAVGRKLDFLLQEINRETNTIGSKAQNTHIAHLVVDVKSELEKIREQIQNLE